MTRPVLQLVQAPAPTDQLRRRFRQSIKADRQQMAKRFVRRIGTAAATGALAYGAIRAGAPAALRRVAAFEKGQHAGKVALGLEAIGRNVASSIPGVRRFVNPAKTEVATEAFAKKAIGITAAKYMRSAVHGAVKHRGKIAAGAAGTHLIGGSIHDARKTRRDQNKLARKLLTL